ncbi:MAG: lipopolysaccharide biosynthesis protein [Actinobacteria bacterium]|nr:MAG: lipopolysaccharide biosynthesis protein [Actinomycetota bacterium]
MSAVQEAPAAVRSRGTSARRDRFLARRLGLITFALAISGSTTLLFNVVLARKLSPTEFGDIARTFALALTVGQLTMTGVAPAVARIVAQAEDDAGRFARARAGIWTLALFTFVVSLLFFPLALAGLAPTDPLQLALGWGVAFVYAFYFGLKMLLFVLDRAREYALFEGASDVIFFVVLGASAVLAPRYGLASFSVAYGIFVVGVIAYIVRRAKTRERIVLGRAFAKHAFLTAVSTYGSVARFPLVVSIAGLVGTRHDAAEMAVIFSLVMPLYLLPRAAGFMTFANVARRAEGAAEDVCRTVRAVSLVGAFGIFVGVLFAHPLIQLVLGARYLEAATALMIVAVCLTPAMASVPIANAGSADGRVADKAAISAFGLAVAAVGAYLLTPSHHAVGAALAVGGSMVITGGLSLVRAHFHYRLRFADIAGATVLFLCSAAAVVVQPGLALSIVVLGLSLCAIFSYARKTLALPLSVNRPEFLIAPVAGLVILCLRTSRSCSSWPSRCCSSFRASGRVTWPRSCSPTSRSRRSCSPTCPVRSSFPCATARSS